MGCHGRSNRPAPRDSQPTTGSVAQATEPILPSAGSWAESGPLLWVRWARGPGAGMAGAGERRAGCLRQGGFWPAGGAGFRGAPPPGRGFCFSLFRGPSRAPFSLSRFYAWGFQKKRSQARNPGSHPPGSGFLLFHDPGPFLGRFFLCPFVRLGFPEKESGSQDSDQDQGQETLGGEPGFSPGRRGGSRLFSLWEAGQPFHDSAKHGKNPFLGEKWSRTDQSVRQRILYRFEGKNTTELPTYIWPFPRTLHFVL